LLDAADRKVDGAQGMAGVLLDLSSRFVCEAADQDDHQTGTEIPKDWTTCALH
jgi:hypothetical protein